MIDHTESPFLISKGLRPVPFLLPKAPPASAAKIVAQQQDWMTGLHTGGTAKKAAKRGKNPYDLLPRGPRANNKVMRALSGEDASETLSRIGRATRRQDKEFHAQVHPISGRVKEMVRGDHTASHFPNPSPTKARLRMTELADTAKNPKVRDRATRSATGRNENIAGPKPLYVHNHPENPGRKARMKRSYPSQADAAAQDYFPGGFKGAVVSRHDAPRGGKKTKVVYFGPGPDKVKGSRVSGKKTRGQRPVTADREERLNRAEEFRGQDFATQPKSIQRLQRSDLTGSRKAKSFAVKTWQSAAKEHAERDELRGGELKAWDKYVKERTASPGEATKTGLHTRERLMKRNSFGVVHKGYGVARAYKQALSPAAQTLKTATGKLKPVLPSKPVKSAPKHKKSLQLGF